MKQKFCCFLIAVFLLLPVYSQQDDFPSNNSPCAIDFVLAASETIFINLSVISADMLIKQKPTPLTFDNIKSSIIAPWTFDDSPFIRNQLLHPYLGSMYFVSARANKLNFAQSALMAAAGSYFWENFCQIGNTSINDLITTTIAGSITGEVLHRLGSICYDINPILGFAVSPIDGLNQFIRGKTSALNGKLYWCDFNIGGGVQNYIEDNLSGTFNCGVSIIYNNPYGHKSTDLFDQFSIQGLLYTNVADYFIQGKILGQLYSAPVFVDSIYNSNAGVTLNYSVNISSDFNYSINDFGLFLTQEIPLNKLSFFWNGQLCFNFLQASKIQNINHYNFGPGGRIEFGLKNKSFKAVANLEYFYLFPEYNYKLQSFLCLDFYINKWLAIGANNLFVFAPPAAANYTSLYFKFYLPCSE